MKTNELLKHIDSIVGEQIRGLAGENEAIVFPYAKELRRLSLLGDQLRNKNLLELIEFWLDETPKTKKVLGSLDQDYDFVILGEEAISKIEEYLRYLYVTTLINN
ncbi:MAG: hypothetical protein KTR20_07940 [Cellvibrionaceae bacterium]|nr:hypothetical protein [Cellvibrionaceae bacterium]